jgi:putative PEP-CTERM system histidine kinase
MDSANVTASAYLSASIVSLVLTVTYGYHCWLRKHHWSIPIAALATSLWLSTVALYYNFSLTWLSPILLYTTEVVHYFCWINAVFFTLKKVCNTKLPFSSKILLGLGSFIGFGSFIIFVIFLTYGIDSFHVSPLHIWSGLCLSLIGVASIEQLYRNIKYNRYIKLMSLCLGLLFIFDIYLYANAIVFNVTDPNLVQARAGLTMTALSMMCIGAVTLRYEVTSSATLNFSRPIAFYSTSLSLIGGLLSLLALGIYYIKLYSGEWGTVIYSSALFLAIIAVTIPYTSRNLRERLSVLINKHLFVHKYDYRSEWLNLIEKLSRPSNTVDTYRYALSAVMSVFKSPGGILWISQGQCYHPAHYRNVVINSLPDEPVDSRFVSILKEKEWIFSPNSTAHLLNNQFDRELPKWASDIPKLWFFMPLITENKLVGFIALTTPVIESDLGWEDIGLIKAVGRQVADYLYRNQQAEQLTESRQFDTFNKLTAFVMHDLKNLIAQQALVVENAAKYKDNPAFVDDAIKTIDNSVSRMNTLLKKLQRNQPEEIASLSLRRLISDACQQCLKGSPIPALTLPDDDLIVSADNHRLSMAIVHLITNAQEATPASGYVNVTMTIDNKIATIEIEDNGLGMDKKFISERLFKPFDTTKSGKGMGIGAYQAREYINNLNGTFSVTSTPKVGTKFVITLPGTINTR